MYLHTGGLWRGLICWILILYLKCHEEVGGGRDGMKQGVVERGGDNPLCGEGNTLNLKFHMSHFHGIRK